MPYIKSDDGRREALRNGEPAITAGELNYRIYYFAKHYVPNPSSKRYLNRAEQSIGRFVKQFLGEKPNYQRYNDMTGCLVLCAKEIYRRLKIDLYEDLFKQIIDSYDEEINRYEDKKIVENGDVE